ncbi:hypothetical protein CRYUN_Cryun02cG0148900 [Craigia yunnanensis]
MAKLGGVTKFEGHVNNLEMRNLARFAVDEHNKKENAMLEFKKVVNVKKLKEVEEIRYYITLEAMDGDKLNIYEAIVWVRPWLNFQGLEDFKLIGDAPAASTATA